MWTFWRRLQRFSLPLSCYYSRFVFFFAICAPWRNPILLVKNYIIHHLDCCMVCWNRKLKVLGFPNAFLEYWIAQKEYESFAFSKSVKRFQAERLHLENVQLISILGAAITMVFDSISCNFKRVNDISLNQTPYADQFLEELW